VDAIREQRAAVKLRLFIVEGGEWDQCRTEVGELVAEVSS
jgi:hypothetical protein